MDVNAVSRVTALLAGSKSNTSALTSLQERKQELCQQLQSGVDNGDFATDRQGAKDIVVKLKAVDKEILQTQVQNELLGIDDDLQANLLGVDASQNSQRRRNRQQMLANGQGVVLSGSIFKLLQAEKRYHAAKLGGVSASPNDFDTTKAAADNDSEVKRIQQDLADSLRLSREEAEDVLIAKAMQRRREERQRLGLEPASIIKKQINIII